MLIGSRDQSARCEIDPKRHREGRGGGDDRPTLLRDRRSDQRRSMWCRRKHRRRRIRVRPVTDQHIHRTVCVDPVARRGELFEDGPGGRAVFDVPDSAQPESDGLQPLRGCGDEITAKARNDTGPLADLQLNDRPDRKETSWSGILDQHDADAGVAVLNGPGDDDAKVERHHHARRLRHRFPHQVRHRRVGAQIGIALGGCHHSHRDRSDGGDGRDAHHPPPGSPASTRRRGSLPAGRKRSDRWFIL